MPPSRAAAAACGRVVAFTGRAGLRRAVAVAGMELVCRERGEERSGHVLGAAQSVRRRAAAAMVVALAVELLAI